MSGIEWQDAVAVLARERAQAVAAARIVKKHAAPAESDRLSLVYGEAKAEYDGVIGGLVVALARKKPPEALADLEERLQRGFAKREEFCKAAAALLPAPKLGEKGVLEDILKALIEPVVTAVKEIYLRSKDDDALMRKTIETQLQAASWPDFAAVKQES